MAKKTRIVPDLYFPNDEETLPTPNVEEKGGHGREVGVEGGKTVDLTPKGFIPIHRLTLGDLPEQIRTEEHLQYILDVSKNIVKIHNNGLSEKRPDDDEFKMSKQKTFSGSGFLMNHKGRNVKITTNRHVLFNVEELQKSTFDVFYDHHVGDPDDRKKLFKRCGRRNGNGFFGKFTKADIANASYTVKDNMAAHIQEHCLSKDAFNKSQSNLAQSLGSAADPNRPPTVCLISHPLGQPKHISFGEMVDYNMQSRTIHHTAPSEPGSSGGRIVVFSFPLFLIPIIHVGTERVDGKIYKYGRLQYFEPSLDVCDTIQAHPTIVENSSREKGLILRLDEIWEQASACVEANFLGAFAPLFGAFLLHAEETCLTGLDTSALKPCRQLLTVDSLTSHDLKEVIRKLAELAPSFNVFPSSKLDDASDLVSLLEHSGPCFCQSIVQIMQRGVKLEAGTATECFLSPHKAAAKMSTDNDVTWPWRDGTHSDLGSDDAEENCLLKKCLDLGHKDVRAVMLLLMITKANIGIKEFCFQSRVDSSDMTTATSESQWETVYVRSKQIHPSEQRSTKKQPTATLDPPPQAGKKLRSSRDEEVNWHRLIRDVLIFMYSLMTSVHVRNSAGPLDKLTGTAQREEDDLSILYSRCLAFSEHARQHDRQIHSDTGCDGQGDSSGNWCRCGRPGFPEFMVPHIHLMNVSFKHQMIGKNLPYTADTHEIDKANRARRQLQIYSFNTTWVDFVKTLEVLQGDASRQSLPPGPFILTALDSIGAFPRGRHSLMLFLASEEAFLYNYCLLARHISQSLQPWYFAFPVAVFGRPGNWPGNVTSPEVRHTAWRLIEEAIMASGFRPAVLLALHEDADRREKLIDLYVDLKQLKWERRIQPQLFDKYLADSKRDMLDYLQIKLPFDNCTHYIVWYATYLTCPQIFASRSFISQP